MYTMSDDNTKQTGKSTVTTPRRQVEFIDWPCQEAAHALWPSRMRSPPKPQCVWLLLSAACTVSTVGGVNIGVNFKLEGNNSGVVYTTQGGGSGSRGDYLGEQGVWDQDLTSLGGNSPALWGQLASRGYLPFTLLHQGCRMRCPLL